MLSNVLFWTELVANKVGFCCVTIRNKVLQNAPLSGNAVCLSVRRPSCGAPVACKWIRPKDGAVCSLDVDYTCVNCTAI